MGKEGFLREGDESKDRRMWMRVKGKAGYKRSGRGNVKEGLMEKEQGKYRRR